MGHGGKSRDASGESRVARQGGVPWFNAEETEEEEEPEGRQGRQKNGLTQSTRGPEKGRRGGGKMKEKR